MCLKLHDKTVWRKDGPSEKVFEAFYIAEGSIDDGGPFREAIDGMSAEL